MLALIGPDIRTRYESGYRLHSFGLLRVYSLVGGLDLSVGVTSLPTVPSARQVANLTEASVLTMVGLR